DTCRGFVVSNIPKILKFAFRLVINQWKAGLSPQSISIFISFAHIIVVLGDILSLTGGFLYQSFAK
ncbi:hypothetical protein, partial [Photobacterium damselae]|uniref:hypothetical protein n=1 Tax=Photobacterium damselae TaxID=38293 RepID=UPI001C3D0EE8